MASPTLETVSEIPSPPSTPRKETSIPPTFGRRKQEAVSDMQACLDARFSSLQNDLDANLAKYMVQLQKVTSEREQKMDALEARVERKMADLEVVVLSGLEDIRVTKKSLLEFADDLEKSLKPNVEPEDRNASLREMNDLVERIGEDTKKQSLAHVQELRTEVTRSLMQLRKEVQDVYQVQRNTGAVERMQSRPRTHSDASNDPLSGLNWERDISSLREEVQSLRRAAQKAQISKKVLAENDDGSTQFPSDASDDTASSVEDGKGKATTRGSTENTVDPQMDTTDIIKRLLATAAVWNHTDKPADVSIKTIEKSITGGNHCAPIMRNSSASRCPAGMDLKGNGQRMRNSSPTRGGVQLMSGRQVSGSCQVPLGAYVPPPRQAIGSTTPTPNGCVSPRDNSLKTMPKPGLASTPSGCTTPRDIMPGRSLANAVNGCAISRESSMATSRIGCPLSALSTQRSNVADSTNAARERRSSNGVLRAGSAALPLGGDRPRALSPRIS